MTMYDRTRPRLFVYAAAGLAVLLIGIFSTLIWILLDVHPQKHGAVAPEIARSEKSGDLIAGKLLQYRKDKGRFPDSLSDLVPAYVPSIPIPATGHKWNYDHTNLTFVLSFDTSDSENFSRDEVGIWRSDKEGT
jgi:hypothetical protein